MKKTLTVITAAGLMGILAISNAWAGRIVQRQAIQAHRIARGVASGELTCSETRILVRSQRGIRHARDRAWADGRLTRGERLRIERRQNVASHRIYRFKHNARQRH